MKSTDQHERMANMIFGSIYPLYLKKIEQKGRSQSELNDVISWLTGFNEKQIQEKIDLKINFRMFFEAAQLPTEVQFIKGLICGYRVEEISNPLTQKIRYLDKLVDELAKGKSLDKIIRKS